MQSSYTQYPISCHDIAIPSVLTYGFVIDGCIDHDLVRDGVVQLVHRWPLLGARIARQVNDDDGRSGSSDTLVYHVPTLFTPDTPEISYRSAAYDTPLEDHFTIPRPTTTTSTYRHDSTLFQPPPHLHHSSHRAYAETEPAQPILHLQIATFSDAKSTVGITVPHCFCDAGGMREILVALGQVLAGGKDVQLPLLDTDTLRLERIQPAPSDLPPSSLWVLPAATAATKSASAPPALPLQEREEPETRWLFIPRATLHSLKQDAIAALAAEGQDDLGLSSGDVLVAWLAKMVLAGEDDGVDATLPSSQSSSWSSARPRLVLTVPMNLRNRLTELADKVYLHNALHAIAVVFDSRDALCAMPIHSIALEVRKRIQQEGESEAIRRTLAFKTKTYYSTPDRSIVATHSPQDAERVTLSNWLSLRAGQDWPDFHPAIRCSSRKVSTADTGETGMGGGGVLWLDVSTCSISNARPQGVAARSVADGIWLWYTLPRWRWSVGPIAQWPYNMHSPSPSTTATQTTI